MSEIKADSGCLQAVRACPVCRQATHYVTPSLVWPADEDEKEAIRGAYRQQAGVHRLQELRLWRGHLPFFGTSCMYRHAYKNGQLEVHCIHSQLLFC